MKASVELTGIARERGLYMDVKSPLQLRETVTNLRKVAYVYSCRKTLIAVFVQGDSASILSSSVLSDGYGLPISNPVRV